MTPSIRVFLLDDHEIVRRGVAELLADEPGIVVVGEAGAVAGTAEEIIATSTTVALLDCRLPDGGGVEVCRAVKAVDPSIGCIILASYRDHEAELAAVIAGADGYLLKEVRAKRLVESIRRVAAGGSLVDPAMRQRAEGARTGSAQEAAPDEALPVPRTERELLSLVAQGLSNRAIAARLSLSERAVRSRIAGALGVQRRSRAGALAAELQHVDIEPSAP